MRRPYSLWLVLLVCTGLAFWLEGAGRSTRDPFLQAWGLGAESLAAGYWWTWLTHAFLHGSWGHAAMNLVSLWVVGRHAVKEWGNTGFVLVLAAAAVAGGLAQMALTPARGPLSGLAGGVFGLGVATALEWGQRRVAFGVGRWHLFTLRGRSLGWGVLVAAWLTALAARLWPAALGPVGHACHAGGALAGALVVWLGAFSLADRRSTAEIPAVRADRFPFDGRNGT